MTLGTSRKKEKNDVRLDFRLNRQVKEVIERAAAVSGQSVSEFAVSTLYRTEILSEVWVHKSLG